MPVFHPLTDGFLFQWDVFGNEGDPLLNRDQSQKERQRLMHFLYLVAYAVRKFMNMDVTSEFELLF